MKRISATVNHIASFFKRSSLGRLMAVVLAGLLLMTTTACNPSSPQAVGNGSYREKVGQQTETYDPIQKRKDGMNMYEDTDPRRGTKAADAKAKALIDSAQRNADRQGLNPAEALQQVGRDLPKNAQRAAENAADFAQDRADEAAQGTRNATETFKRAGQEVSSYAQDRAQETANNAGNAAQSAKQAGQNAIDSTRDRA